MKRVDEQRLQDDLEYRFDYLREFLEFTSQDVAVIRELIPQLGPRVDAMVERTYEKLLAFDATARHFVERGEGYDGALAASVESLHAQDEQIKFRKNHLRSYLMNVLGRPYDGSMARYLDTVGKMHTPQAGSERIDVPLAQMNAFMGMLSIIFIEEIEALDLEREQAMRAVKAFTKLAWIQNDFIARHY